jgi:small-conductance mechanosensitive channel
MLRDLRTQITSTRRAIAWGLLALLLVGIVLSMVRYGTNPDLIRPARAVFWCLAAYLIVRLIAYLLLDPLMRERKTATPGFARDLVLVAAYAIAIEEILRRIVGVNVSALLGTGAIAAAVVGFSLQETLGNLFAGISMRLDPSFQVGDWIEVTGNVRGGAQRDTLIGQVESITWRSVHLRTENGDMDIFPNRIIAQAVVTNLYVPAGQHRRTGRVIVEPHQDLHIALDKLTLALAGIPHDSEHPPQVVVQGFDQGGAVLEMRWWASGFRDGKAGQFHAFRLANTVLPREGFPLLGPHGATTMRPKTRELSDAQLSGLLRQLQLPIDWVAEMRGKLHVRHAAPGEAIIRAGDPGESLFAVLTGSLKVVKAVERTEPYTGIFWDTIAELHDGDWFGEASLLTGAPRSATVVAETLVELAEIPKVAFEANLRREPHVVEKLVDLMEKRATAGGCHAETHQRGMREQWLKQIKTWFGVT